MAQWGIDLGVCVCVTKITRGRLRAALIINRLVHRGQKTKILTLGDEITDERIRSLALPGYCLKNAYSRNPSTWLMKRVSKISTKTNACAFPRAMPTIDG